MSGIFQIPSPIESTYCQKLANDFSALPQLYLAIKDGPGHMQRIWETCSKLQVRPGHVQTFEPCDWLEGYKIAFSYLHLVDLQDLRKRDFTYRQWQSTHQDLKNHTNPDQAI